MEEKICNVEGFVIETIYREEPESEDNFIPTHLKVNMEGVRKSTDRIITINNEHSIPKILEECDLKIYCNILKREKYFFLEPQPPAIFRLSYSYFNMYSNKFPFPIDNVPNGCRLLLNLTPQPDVSKYDKEKYEVRLISDEEGKVISEWIKIKLPERIQRAKDKHDEIFGEWVTELNKNKVIDEAENGLAFAKDNYDGEYLRLSRIRDINIRKSL